MNRKTTDVRAHATGRAGQPAPTRRKFLARGAKAAGALALGGAGAISNTAQAQIAAPPWMKTPGAASPGYGQPSKFEAKVQRVWGTGYATVTPGAGATRTPLQSLNGTLTPI